MSKKSGSSEGLGTLVRAYRPALAAIGAFSFFINLLMLVPALYMLQIYDRVLASRNEVTLLMLSIIMLGLYVLEAGIELVRSQVVVRATSDLDVRLSERVFDASFERYLRERTGNPVRSLGELAVLRQFLSGPGLFAFFDAPWTPLFIAVIFLLHPWLGVFALVASLLLMVTAYFNEKLTRAWLAESGRLAAAANHNAASSLRNAEAIEAMGMLVHLRRRWFRIHGRFLAAQAVAAQRAVSLNAIARFLRFALQSGILGLGALLVIDNQMSAGAMIAASILLGRALSPVEAAIANWRNFNNARAAYARLNELLEAQPPREQSMPLPRPEGRVVAENLVVGVPASRVPIIKGASFQVAPGSVVAVIGPSAAGKSTLARALVGAWAPLGGALRLDGAEVHKWNKAELGAWIGYLPQDVELFEGTVAENIARFAEPDAELVVRAARRAGVHELVLQLAQGYDTTVGDGGLVLSHGQRQRIALARALYGDPALLVLDEPNAHLDEAGDLALIEALRLLKEEGRTVFVMTQRANVLAVADSVMVLASGTIRAFGPRDQVLKVVAGRTSTAVAKSEARPSEDAA